MNQNIALNTLVQGVVVAQKRGAYDLKEASVLAEAVAVFTQTTETAAAKEDVDIDETNE